MKLIQAHRLVSTVVAVAICISAIAVGVGVFVSSRAMAQTVDVAFDPRIGDYAKAQRDLEQHLDQRLRLHLSRSLQRAGK
jgi:hypothetical protein